MDERLKSEVLHEALQVVQRNKSKDKQNKMLYKLATNLSQVGCLHEAINIEHMLESNTGRFLDWSWPVKLVESLTHRLPEPLRSEVVQEAAEIAKYIEEPSSLIVYDDLGRIHRYMEEISELLLQRLIPRLPEPLRSEVVQNALEENTKSRRMGELVEYVEGISHPYIPQIQRDRLYPIWKDIFHNSSSLSRRAGLIGRLFVLIPFMTALGGKEAVEETARAIMDVESWWH